MTTTTPGYDEQDWALVRRAADLAWEKHEGEYRKGGATVPYISHVWTVASIVMEHGGTAVQAAAALLHDTAEDAGGEKVLDEIREACGTEVADLVRALSDSLVENPEDKAPWPSRKKTYLTELRSAPDPVHLVSAADKLANARSMLSDFAQVGPALWERFRTKSAADQFWYYETLIEIFDERGTIPALTGELRETIAELRRRDEASGGRTQPAEATGAEPGRR